MKCPNCNQWNRASLPRCIRCGTPLAGETDKLSWQAKLREDRRLKEYVHVDEDGDVDTTPDDRELLAAEMAELKDRKDDGIAHQERLRRSSARRGSTIVTPPPEEMDDSARPAGVPFRGHDPAADAEVSAGRSRSARQANDARVILNPGRWEDSRSYDPVVDDMWEKNVFQQRVNLREQQQVTYSRRMGLRRLISVLTVILIVGVVGLAGYVGVNLYQQYAASRSAANRALITASIMDDMAAHTILIPGEDGQDIYISNKEIRKAYPVVNGFATIEIADYTWYAEMSEITEPTMAVTLYPSLKTSSGNQKPMDPVTYDITIPLSPITLVTPVSLRTEVTTAMYSLTFNVRSGSTVTINGEDVSDAVNEEGILTYNANVQPIGDNVYDVRVRSPYCRDNQLAVTLYREVQEIPLDLAATTYTSTSEKAVQISATTLPGADINILTPHSDLNITYLDTTGEFTFYAVFEKVGTNTISIEASYPGKKTSHVDYNIYYLPNPDVYTPKAWPLNSASDYAELLSNITFRAERAQIYVAVGVIDHFVSDKPQMAVMYCSDDGKSQPVLLENQTTVTWEAGKFMRVYCDAYGTYSGMPWLIGRYTYY